MLWDSFHFLRPLWLLMIVPAIVITFLLKNKLTQKNSWNQVIAPHLLPHLLDKEISKRSLLPIYLLLAAWVLGSVSLAGPTWEKISVPFTKQQQSLVVVADMSLNTLSTDVKPNRLSRLKYKLLDLFKARAEGFTAIVVYSETAHVVAPLTDDSRTLANLVNALSPEIMPAAGNNVVAGVESAINLLQQGDKQKNGHILLITDHVTKTASQQIIALVNNAGLSLSVIGQGSEQGAPITLENGTFLKDSSGNIIIPQRDRESLKVLAQKGQGIYHDFTLNDNDLNATLPDSANAFSTTEVEKQFDQWHDVGFWLIPLLLLFAMGSFRRGWLTVILLTTLLPRPQQAMAFDWDSLWYTNDQRGAEALKSGQIEEAAELFDTPSWKAEALYQAKKYKEAAELLAGSQTPTDLYNQGNALAQSQELEQAITAYQQALTKLNALDNSNNEKLKDDIQFNQEQVKKLLQLKQAQQNQQSDQQNQQDGQQNQQSAQQNQQDGQQNQQDGQQNQQDGQQNQQDGQQNQQDGQQNQQDGQQNQQDGQQNQQDGQQNQQDGQQNQQDGQQNQQDGQQNQQDGQQNQQDGQQNQQSAQQSQQDAKQNPPGKEHTQQSTASATDEEQQPEEQIAKQAQPQDAQNQQSENSSSTTEGIIPQSVEAQALESWLRTIPDDPGGLLRRKFQQQREQEQRGRQR